MNTGWFYQREGRTQGPISTEEIQKRARAGLLGPHDLIWAEEASQQDAIEAQCALDFTRLTTVGPPLASPPIEVPTVPAETLPAAEVPDWLQDVSHLAGLDREGRAASAGPDSAGAGLPDWLADVPANTEKAQGRPTPAPPRAAGTNVPIAIPVSPPYSGKKPAKQKSLDGSLRSILEQAQTEVDNWINHENNKVFVDLADIETIATFPEVKDILDRYQDYGPELQEMLGLHLQAIVEARKKELA